MGLFNKKKNITLEEINKLIEEIKQLSDEAHIAFKEKNEDKIINYSYLIYSKIEYFRRNTNLLDFLENNNSDVFFIFNIQLCAISDIINILYSFPEYNQLFKGKHINYYVIIGEEYANFLYKSKDIKKEFGLLSFLDTLKHHYEYNNDYKKAAEYVHLIKKYKGSDNDDEDDEDFEEKVDKKKKIYTKSGIAVQSYGEQRIADYLADNDIDFNYDKQITLAFNEPNKNGHKQEWVRPDFYLPEFAIVIEYWGMKGDPDYDAKKDWKERKYAESGTKYISFSKEDLPNLKDKLDKKLKRLGVNL